MTRRSPCQAFLSGRFSTWQKLQIGMSGPEGSLRIPRTDVVREVQGSVNLGIVAWGILSRRKWRARASLEAAGGIEPPNNGFADRRLTAWLSRLLCGAHSKRS